jgi:hypothetical protein
MPIPRRIKDLLREGQAPDLIRRKGADGSLAVSLAEKIEILAILSQDAEEAIRNQAKATLAAWDAAELQEIFSNPQTPVFLLDFAARHLAAGREEIAPSLLANAALPAELRELIRSQTSGAAARQTPSPAASSQKSAAESHLPRETLLQKITRMSVAEKINAALLGNQEERAVLIRDPNKIVSRAVLQSPKLTDQEIESISMMKNVSEEVLRLVATNRKFIRSYSVVRNLANNPRAAVDVILPFVNRLNDRDLKELSRNKNVAEVLRAMAFKLLKQKEAAKKG